MSDKFLIDIYLKGGQTIRFENDKEVNKDNFEGIFETLTEKIFIIKDDVSAIVNRRITNA